MPNQNKKSPPFKKTQSSFFYDSNNFALPRFPTVYQLELPKKYKYTKTYDVLYELYFENDRLLDRDDLFLYNYLQSLANRGLILRLNDFAEFVGMKKHNLIAHFDKLEDALLIHRVGRNDLHGKPNDLIVHLPATYDLWEGGHREKTIKRLKTQETRLNRKEKSIAIIDDATGKERFFVPRSNQKFSFNYKKVFRETFDNEADAENFAKSLLRHFQDAKDEILNDVKAFDRQLRQRVKESFLKSNQHPQEKHYFAALTMRRIYAPALSEF